MAIIYANEDRMTLKETKMLEKHCGTRDGLAVCHWGVILDQHMEY